jgi:GNAT superfamily N-acetyltransferase
MIRPARPVDRAAVEDIVCAAYAPYIERIGKPPAPMLDDYGARIAEGSVHALEAEDGTVAAIIVLVSKADHLLLDNLAVRPDRQRRGLGRSLVAFAEAEALRLGLAALRIYTHEKMTENIALYRRLGFVETGRGREVGYDRVFMAKRLAPKPLLGSPRHGDELADRSGQGDQDGRARSDGRQPLRAAAGDARSGPADRLAATGFRR